MNIYIWGTGRLTGKVVDRHIPLNRITGFVDNDASKKEYMGKPVYTPLEVASMNYDAILVCNLYSDQILEQCKEIKIDRNKVICLYNNCKIDDVNIDYEFVKAVVGEEYAKVVMDRYKIVRGVEAYGDLFLENCERRDMLQGYMRTDYVRIKCFELAVKEIRKRKIGGAVAELGVFRGEFAQFINAAFPDKTLYLFDTFAGFNANEALDEKKKGNCSESFIEAYKKTDISIVLDRMTNLDSVVIKQGFFPESLGQLEEKFAFVSLDADFEESIYQGLVYFYPRLEKGGYIFIHDYSSDLLGVEKAVDRYETDNDIKMCKVPLCDANGTLVVTK
ncbi:TylF/MycF/NovP-related O-methyltransferase [Butyrivibrio sp. ob235]|uniref:TylF/MycF/NovP-related O-methyltransferase n=1 Tax=Butyrivibrio sp. ob235 TaxID=1761780 RepID=UPI001587DA47|nr:TylF/MycF/NovP-related O-methyltransferase [Butyrivibrio sp. ob235]